MRKIDNFIPVVLDNEVHYMDGLETLISFRGNTLEESMFFADKFADSYEEKE